jgi:hypothetical protein
MSTGPSEPKLEAPALSDKSTSSIFPLTAAPPPEVDAALNCTSGSLPSVQRLNAGTVALSLSCTPKLNERLPESETPLAAMVSVGTVAALRVSVMFLLGCAEYSFGMMKRKKSVLRSPRALDGSRAGSTV